MRIYVASSWRNERQPGVVRCLADAGHDVYDFRHPATNNNGFHWSEIDAGWQSWSPSEFVRGLEHRVAREGFSGDMDALQTANAVLLVMPCGRSAHLELGWAIGNGKASAILLWDGEPELMYRMVDRLCVTMDDVMEWASGLRPITDAT